MVGLERIEVGRSFQKYRPMIVGQNFFISVQKYIGHAIRKLCQENQTFNTFASPTAPQFVEKLALLPNTVHIQYL